MLHCWPCREVGRGIFSVGSEESVEELIYDSYSLEKFLTLCSSIINKKIVSVGII